MDALMKSYLKYDPNKDYNGAQGRAIVDTLLDRCGGNLEVMKRRITLARLEKSLLEISETGTAEEEYLRTFDKEGKKEIEKIRTTSANAKYSLFYDDWQRLHINERDYGADSDRKRKSLLRFHKFRKDGKQPVLDYSHWQIGYLYAKILEQAKKSRGQ